MCYKHLFRCVLFTCSNEWNDHSSTEDNILQWTFHFSKIFAEILLENKLVTQQLCCKQTNDGCDFLVSNSIFLKQKIRSIYLNFKFYRIIGCLLALGFLVLIRTTIKVKQIKDSHNLTYFTIHNQRTISQYAYSLN